MEKLTITQKIMVFFPLILSIIGLIIAIFGNYLDRWQFSSLNNYLKPKRNYIGVYSDSHGLENENKFRYENFLTKVNGFLLYRYHMKEK